MAATRAPARREDDRTRERLLGEAARLFADHGFKRVTVRQICRAAGANVAAVNYHFGDKLGLYREVLQHAIDGMAATNEAGRAAGEGRPPEEKLRRFLEIFLAAILKPEHAIYHRLLQREVQDATPMLDAVVQQGIKPRLEYLASVVGEMIGAVPTDRLVLQCVGSINAQAIIYMPNPIATRLGYEFKAAPADIAQAADHIAAFSIGGVRAVSRAEEKGTAPVSGPPKKGTAPVSRPRKKGTAPVSSRRTGFPNKS
jgi:TetR/AcrR family transcriptional regulator, regulator of cefoperazone and chloramphenicol sensitivity